MDNLKNETPKLSVKNYLRADPHTQIFDCQGEKLVTDDMFWGNESEQSIYLDYRKISGKNIKVSEGISYSSRSIEDEECDKWLENNLYNIKTNILYVFQGYAGCGKTTLMRHIAKFNKDTCKICYIDIGSKWRLEREQNLLFSETLSKFLDELESVLKLKEWNIIWDNFMELGRDTSIDALDSAIRPVMGRLKGIIEFYEIDILTDGIIENIIIDVAAFLSERFNIDRNGTQNKGEVGSIISLLVLLVCAIAKSNRLYVDDYMLIYDNLDVITNPSISAEMILSLWSVIINFKDYSKQFYEGLPNFVFCIAVRKMLYTHITSYLPELEHNLPFDNECVITCDISELYPSEKILEHRIKYWLSKENLTESIRSSLNSLNRIKLILGKVSDGGNDEDEYYLPKETIDLDGLFNHNFRACANMLSEFLDDSNCSKFIIPIFENDKYNYMQKTAALIFAISFIYRKLNIWNKLGFGCKGCNSSIYPTTLFRVILTQLYVSKIASSLKNNSFAYNKEIPMDDFVSMDKIIESVSHVPFIKILSSYSQDQINDQYKSVTKEENEKSIYSMLAQMCTTGRTMTEPLSRGYTDDNELWRRPVYFTRGIKATNTAVSYEELYHQFQNEVSNNIKFSITDEGCIIVSDFVASFEFYSARYCENNLAKPLYLAKNTDELKKIIDPVFCAVRLCCERQITFMNSYISSYAEGKFSTTEKNRYLMETFHPRTNPRFRDDGSQKLIPESFRPQLHIVRVIYNHIFYLDEVKSFISQNSNKIEMCKMLTKYIGKYLNLYKESFYDTLSSSIGNYNNCVYDDLHCLFEYQEEQYKSNKCKNININRKNKELLKQLGRLSE
ncbi:MAG: hypothetical protein K2N51_14050 [Lachnospiraceae bacterium]|nr:hypothetical protein [Lachnospiraceae bacterium]